MNAKQLYQLALENHPVGDTDLWSYSDLLSDTDDIFNNVDYGKNELVCVREIHYQHLYEGDRSWQLASLWFDEKPIAILQLGGRGGRDHTELYGTDEEGFNQAIDYLKSLSSKGDLNIEIIPDEEDIPWLTEFYNADLLDYYDKDLVLPYKEGDIVTAQVADEIKYGYIFDDCTFTERKVKITDVYQNNVKFAYRAVEVDRMLKEPGMYKHNGEFVDTNGVPVPSSQEIPLILSKDLQQVV